jgi:hypothetical protein
MESLTEPPLESSRARELAIFVEAGAATDIFVRRL